MGFDPTEGPRRRPNLERLATASGWRLTGIGCVALIGGVLLTILAFFGPFFFCLTPLLFLAGIVGVPGGLFQALFPLSHPAIRPLGRSSEERRAKLAEIEDEILLPATRHLRLAKGGHLSATPGWIALYGGSELFLAPRDDVLWIYEKRRRSNRTVVVRTRSSGDGTWGVAEIDLPRVLALFAESCPRAILGYRKELDRLSADALARRVSQRRP